MTLKDYLEDWSKVIDLKKADKILTKLVASGNTICPLPKNIFKAFKLCPLHNLRCVIIGQDPYNNFRTVQSDTGKVKVPVATGLAFANSSDTPEDAYSPSLDILRESVIDYTIPHRTINFDPSLEKWASQGVLLLNSALSCQAGRVGSHTLLWRPFMTAFLTNLSKCSTGIVYVLMGNMAQSLEPYIDKRFNYVINIRHPSYYARTKTRMPSNIWQQVNKILISQNGYGIEWYKEY